MKRRFPLRLYGHRWHGESAISQLMRKLDPHLRSTLETSQTEEILWKVLTHDLSILRPAA